MLVSCLAYSSILMMDATCSSEKADSEDKTLQDITVYESTRPPVHIEIRVKARRQYCKLIPMLQAFDRVFWSISALRIHSRTAFQTSFSQHLRQTLRVTFRNSNASTYA
jgi:hypothetical protein